MKTQRIALAWLIALSVPAVTGAEHDERLRATLSGSQEVPVVSTVARGRFRATFDHGDQTINYRLTFSGLQGTVTQSHIHVAQKNVNGVIVIWLCQTTTNPAPAAVALLTPVCPQSGTVEGTITAANVVGPTPPAAPTQQIVAGELDEVIAAIREGFAYANIHTNLSPGGEIRGQIRSSDDGDNDKDDDKDDHDRD